MIYVTSDWHGYPFEKIKDMLNKVGFSEEDFLFVLGDVIDRGEDGIKILRWLMSQPNMELILGNHEAMMLACCIICQFTNLICHNRKTSAGFSCSGCFNGSIQCQ